VLVGRLVEHARGIHGAHFFLFDRLSIGANRAIRGKDIEIHFWPRVRPHPVLQFLRRLGSKARIRIAASHLKGASVVKAILELASTGASVEILAEPTLRRVPLEVERMLTQAGIPCRRVTHPEGLPMHNKFVLAEKGSQRWVMFGSFNWTDRSYRLSHEIGAISAKGQL
jgi:phosphatidylserine/phosphatidylglycerophosphate/cardiolipin synthase-like enzyme